ncbi:CDP-alcohol phosphatidyltransferase family protein [Novosphingobium sp.]|uniref:CDP-alcohol phosphatidyltransferase family protein n=1 Tax=Novosphingobium sp. TaxID=1874826 RepID=UPI003B515642
MTTASGTPSLQAKAPKPVSTGPIKRPNRPRELQDSLNHYVYHPLAWRLARALAPTPVTPNMVSVAGGLFVVAAGIVYWWGPVWGLGWPFAALLGLALHMTWHVVDGADGDLARLTGRSSPLGELIDGICDYAGHVALYLMLAAIMGPVLGWGWAWFWVLAGGASHVAQANFVEVQRRFYQYWTYGTPWLNNATQADAALFKDKRGVSWILRGFVLGYLRLASGMSPNTMIIDAAVNRAIAADQAGDGTALAQIRAAVQREQRPLLFMLKFLGPNPRAIVLGVSMLIGSPLWYFVYQVLALNVLLFVAVRREDAAALRVVRQLDLVDQAI